MGSIPLPALDVRPPQPDPNLLSQYAQLSALKNQQVMQPLQQQAAQNEVQSSALDLQQKQIQLQDQKAMQATMQQWGKGTTQPSSPSPDVAAAPAASSSSMPSYDDLVPLAIKNGASWNAVQQLQQHVLQMKSQAATIAMDDARAGSSKADTLKANNGMIVNAMTGVMGLPDGQLAQGISTAAQQLSQQGLFDPQHVQMAQQLATLAQQNPAQARQQLDVQIKSLGGFSQLLDSAQKQAQASQEQGKSDPNSPFYAPSETSVALGTAPKASEIQQGEAQQAANKEVTVQKAVQPLMIQRSAAEGAARATVEAQAARGSNAAIANVPKELIEPAVTAATKAGTEYAQAQSVSQTIKDMMADARNGNVVAYHLIPQEGALEITTSQGVKRINMAEIQNYGGGSLWQRMQGHIGGALTGQTFPSSVLDDMSQMQAAVEKGAQSKYENTLKVVNHNYGSNFTPMESDSSSTPASGSPSSDPFKRFGGIAHSGQQ